MAGNFAGMTVNERLFAAGLLQQFDEALRMRDDAAARSLLSKVGLTGEAAEQTLRAVFNWGAPSVG